MPLSQDQRLQLVQWITALPPTEFEQLLYALKPPAGTISSAPAPQGTRVSEWLNWAEGPLGPGVPEVLALLRRFIAAIAPEKLTDFDAAFGALQQPDLADEICPYQGLETFTPETKQFFYGRQSTVALLQQKLGEFNFVPVIGPSGSGKSSVVRAGLIPSLGKDWQVLEPIKPDEEPMAALRKAMRSLFQRKSDKNRVTELLNQQGLLPVLELLSGVLKGGVQKALLVIDQFEEVFTVCPVETERSQFIDCITAVQTLTDSPLAIVTTMRADFVEPWLDYGDLVQTIQNQAVWLGRLKGDDLRQAIAQPAKDLGYRFEPGLLELIRRDVQEEKNCLPLLEFALTELWQQRDRQLRVLSIASYQQMLQLTGALNQRAEAVYTDDLATAEERDWARCICLELVRIGPDVKDTRQRQPREHLLALGKTDADRAVIEVLVQGQLLVTGTKASPLLGAIR
jgi:energy-coupling factor transporter ATP-binding protein EcfA2